MSHKGDHPDIGGKSYEELIKLQDYGKLLKSCLEKKIKFKDDLFSEESNILGAKHADLKIEWLRPFEITKDPHFILGSASRFDVQQGKLSDCWFISAVCDLTMRPKLFNKVVPKQSFHDSYAGIFRFNFYQYGEWVTVVIDDLLPCHNGKLILGHSSEKQEFWFALLEKAYSKLNGGYDTLNLGNAAEAFVDFTGGVSEIFSYPKPEDVPSDLYYVLYRYYLRNSLICTYINRPGKTEDKLENGLVLKHEYSLTGMCRVKYKGETVKLIRLRNPWGNSVEWNGPWSDNSSEWKSLSEKQKRQIGHRKANDGEFWMPWNHFIAHFNVFECCHLVSDSNSHGEYEWHFFEATGAWNSSNAGGCIKHKDTFPRNPKYVLTIAEGDIDQAEEQEDDKCTVVISLIQKYYRYRKANQNEQFQIGYVIYPFGQLDDKEKGHSLEHLSDSHQVDPDFFYQHKPIGKVNYIERRGNCARFRISPGKYLIIPSTYLPNKEAPFMLRVLISKNTEDRKSYLRKHSVQDLSLAGSDGVATPGIAGTTANTNHSKQKEANGEHLLTVDTPPKHGTNFKLAHTLDPVKVKVVPKAEHTMEKK